jgi:drug/metabolite transporter (DMT)-like permease
MTFAMANFAIGDALVKLSTGAMSVGFVLLAMSLPGLITFSLLARRANQTLFSQLLLSRPVALRNLVEGLTAIMIVSALSLAPLSLVISILQAVPLFVTIGAASILRETVGPRRWAAVLIGLLGVLLMLRPDASGGALGAILALGAALGLAARDIITRMTPVKVGTLQMATWGTATLIPAGILMLPFTGPHPAPTMTALTIVLCAGVANALGYYAITAAMRVGDVSAVTPFRYSRLLFSLFIATLFFAERPDTLTLVGAALVIGSGLFVMWRERVAKR